jgi:hypothetical protein
MAARLVVMVVAGLIAASVAPAWAQAPVVIDRILSRPNGEIITQSDVWQAVELQMLPEAAGSFDAALRAIENRRLILTEVNRLPVREPAATEIDRRRAAWAARLGVTEPALDARLARSGMTVAGLDTWLRNDLRIETYLDQRFSATADADRPAAITAWIALLRERAGLR